MAAEITREELEAKMECGDEFVLVEALSRAHYESSHLPGAINLPYEFIDEAAEVLPDKEAEIVVYCMNPGCSGPPGRRPASSKRWATRECSTTPKASRAGCGPACPSRASTTRDGYAGEGRPSQIVAAPSRGPGASDAPVTTKRCRSCLIYSRDSPWSP